MQNSSSEPTAPTACDSERLCRFLDNDVLLDDASEILSHLKTCAACHAAYSQMQQMQAALRGLPAPSAPYGGAEAARVRVMERVERTVRVGGTGGTSTPAQARNFSRRRLFWAGGTLAAFACAAGVSFMQAPSSVSAISPVSSANVEAAPDPSAPGPSATPRVRLPSQSEMAVFYDLHDAHSASLSAADPTDRRDRAAEARAALLRDTESLADNETP